MVTIPPDAASDRPGKDVKIRAFEAAAVKPLEWEDDTNLEKMIEQGYVKTYRSDVRPKPIARRPDVADLRKPRLNQMIWQIVFGPDTIRNSEGNNVNIALDLIRAEPTFIAGRHSH